MSARRTTSPAHGASPARTGGAPGPVARLRADEVGNRVMSAPGRLEPLASSLLLTLLWCLGLRSLDGLISHGPWVLQSLAVCAATLVVAGLGRSALPQRSLLSVLAGLAAGAGALAWTGRAGPYPEMWWHDPSGALAAVRLQISEGIPPISPSPALASLILLTCLLLSWTSAVLSAGGGDGIAISGLVPAGSLLLPSLFLSSTPPATTLIAAGACLLALILIGAPSRYWPARSHGPGHAHGPRGLRRLIAAAMTALSLALGAVVVNTAPSAPDHVWNPEGAASTVPDLNVSLSQDLVRGSNAVAFSYTGQTQAESVRFTLGVITNLEEGTWTPDATVEDLTVDQARPADPSTSLTAGAALSQAGLSGHDARQRLSPLTITTQGLRSDRLPTLQSTTLVTDPVTTPDSVPPGAQATVPDLSQWHWVQHSTTALAVSQPLNPGSTYSLLGWSAVADAEGRPRTPVPLPPAAPDPEALSAYTSLPGDVPQAVSDLAQEAVAQAGSERSAQAAALVARLRGPDFTYDESAPYDTQHGTSLEAIEAFLQERSGYCVHYASAFTVMARSLGIPTRIAVGYASRSAEPGAWTAVTGHQLHAWPEVWLDDAGWVAFEPTPGGAGLAADEGPQASQAAEPSASPSPAPTSSQAAQPTASAQGAEPTGGGQASPTPTDAPGTVEAQGDRASVLAAVGRILARLAVALAILALLAAPAMARRAQRRRRVAQVRGGGQPAQAAWAELLATARDLGILTGHQGTRAPTEEALEEALSQNLAALRAGSSGSSGSSGGSPPGAVEEADPAAGDQDAAERALRRLRGAVVAERYGPQGRRGLPVEDLLTALGTCASAMSAAVGRGRRIVAVVAPASLLPTGRDPGRRSG